jgi:hypothetical protein
MGLFNFLKKHLAANALESEAKKVVDSPEFAALLKIADKIEDSPEFAALEAKFPEVKAVIDVIEGPEPPAAA